MTRNGSAAAAQCRDPIHFSRSTTYQKEVAFHRLDHDHMALTVTIDDPKMYTRPWVAMDKQALRSQPPDFSMAETRRSPSEMAAYDRLVSSPIVK